MDLTDLEKQQANLAKVQKSDFRASNLFSLLTNHINPGSSILDVGCGSGGLVGYLLEKNFNAKGIDVNENNIKVAKEYLISRSLEPERVSFGLTSDLIRSGEQSDVVFCMDCLEHVEDDTKLFNELIELVRPGGELILTVPALMLLYGVRDKKIGHFKRYEKNDLKILSSDKALEITEIRFWNILGVFPVFITQKLLQKDLNVGFRYGKKSKRKGIIRGLLFLWFKYVENHISPPFGLTLILIARKKSLIN